MAKQTGKTTYYCQHCKHRHNLLSKIGWYHYWGKEFINNPTDWKRT